MNIEREKSDEQPATLGQMTSMLGLGTNHSPVEVAMERAAKIVTDLKFALKRLAQTQTEIDKERIVAMVQEAIERCAREILVKGIREKATASLVEIKRKIETAGEMPQ